MRILIKGGVWKNTEDEILKAAVMKYGKNQWSRVASLLSRKSAKQCKARWYEWLDPSIKKIEWSREEEEKLLHLAKLMPNQWRTIAPIVGRTAGQCMEHYERLLDQAQAEDATENITSDDPRRLRAGEIDPTPETKPARPDPIDMDEDEKEMLSEARARLANTKGKKAKRKARERMLQESRRLAMLQKRRELKAAGIESKLGGPSGMKRKFMDYGTEIPFQKVVPAGFYDISEEDEAGKKMELNPKKFGLELSAMEGRHAKEEEERAKARDKKLMKELFKENAPLAVLKMSEEADPSTLRRRLPLSLPAPQVSENELEEIVKLGKSTLMAAPEGSGLTATQALVGDYSQVFRPSKTPLRTPQQEDIIMQEARNLRVLREMTPLTTTELPELHEGTGFDGITPRRQVTATPNTIATFAQGTPSRGLEPGTPAMSVASTSNRSTTGSKANMIRDQFGLNQSPHDMLSDTFSVSDGFSIMSRSEKEKSRAVKEQLLSQLNSLPEPEYTYEVALSQVVEEDEDDGKSSAPLREDATEVMERNMKQQEDAMREELERRSSVLKRGLPRPVFAPANELISPSLDSRLYSQNIVKASELVNTEMVRILQHEDEKFPVESSSSVTGPPAKRVRLNNKDQGPFEIFDPTALQTADSLIQAELRDNGERYESAEDLVKTITSLQSSVMFVPDGRGDANTSSSNSSSSNGGSFKVPSGKSELLNALIGQFATLANKFAKDRKKVNKVESKIAILTQGYIQRGGNLVNSLTAAQSDYYKTATDLENVRIVREKEIAITQRRLDSALEQAIRAEALEAQSQAKYSEILAYAKLNNIEM